MKPCDCDKNSKKHIETQIEAFISNSSRNVRLQSQTLSLNIFEPNIVLSGSRSHLFDNMIHRFSLPPVSEYVKLTNVLINS